jgi:biotin-dependent carboxylase-like uncharacterized protein
MKVCEIIDPGILCTIQDLGRKGYYSIGILNSGAFDQISFRYGNAILKNSANDAAIEVLWGGLRLAFIEETVIAITGADMHPKVDDAVVPMWRPIQVKKRQILTLKGPPRTGVRAYLCVAGGIDVPEFYGSRSTYLLLGRGGYEGRKLERGDTLSSFEPGNREGLEKADPYIIPVFSDPWQIRILFGLQRDLFDTQTIQNFGEKKWRVTDKANRVGLRLSGQDVKYQIPDGANDSAIGGINPSNIPTEGNPLGSIQCPSETELIVIGPDGPCEGGYAKIGTIITADFHLLGQVKPGDDVFFKPIGYGEAYGALRDQKKRWVTCKTGFLIEKG